jgi:hypothetical protein
LDDFCHAFGLGRTKTYELINTGVLKTVVVGGRRLIPRESAEALLKQGAADNQAASIVALRKATRPATASVNEPREIVQLPGQNNQNNKLHPSKIQAEFLLRRFKWSAPRAALVAELAFANGGSR